MPLNLTTRNLTEQGLPTLLYGPQKATSRSLHPEEFRACLGEWTLFERDVRRSFLSQQWRADVLAYYPDPQERHPHDVYHEQVYCGDEFSIVGRFGQNVGQVMSAVFQNLGMNIRLEILGPPLQRLMVKSLILFLLIQLVLSGPWARGKRLGCTI